MFCQKEEGRDVHTLLWGSYQSFHLPRMGYILESYLRDLWDTFTAVMSSGDITCMQDAVKAISSGSE